VRDLLVSGDNDVAARFRGQVTDNSGFEVNAFGHDHILAGGLASGYFVSGTPSRLNTKLRGRPPLM
jgi:hypothetical protein